MPPGRKHIASETSVPDPIPRRERIAGIWVAESQPDTQSYSSPRHSFLFPAAGLSSGGVPGPEPGDGLLSVAVVVYHGFALCPLVRRISPSVS